MPISWNEIRHNAINFSREWAGARSESAEKQTFWNEFFEVFGIRRRTVASFEEPVRKISGDHGYIDLFWPRVLIVEHKSRGKDLGAAESQAYKYIRNLIDEGRMDEVPRYIIVSDFARIALHDLEPEVQQSLPLIDGRRIRSIEFSLVDLHKCIHEFGFIPGYKQHTFEEQDPINLQAVDIMGQLHDTLEAGGYSGHRLERLLVRILFCLFAEDTGIFEREAFRLYIVNRTADDGSDIGIHLARLFDILNTPPEQRQTNLDETLDAFPYVNGALFEENLGFADFNRDMRNALLAATCFDWSRISPAVFGALFQTVMEPRERRQIGGHYTNERDILKVICSLFLDDLHKEFRRIGKNKAELKRFHQKIAKLRFLDPACGCGNFLVISYRELRLLEIEILKVLYDGKQRLTDIQHLPLIDVDSFYGIEICEWPARIAEVAMWLMDHQMNIRLSEVFGLYFARLPLRKSPTIVCDNALRLDWCDVLQPDKCTYILGNPPFVGKKARTAEQQKDMDLVFENIKGTGVLDYVCCWYVKAAQYIESSQIKVGFVSTNSITQGEQPGILWALLFDKYHIKIHFAHRTFAWESEARGKAHVHVVIIGFACFDTAKKFLYDYEADKNNPHEGSVINISPYLIEGRDAALRNRTKPINNVPEMQFGNMPNDGGNYLFTDEQKEKLLRREPSAANYLRPFLGAKEYLHGEKRWCLWLKNASPSDICSQPLIRDRVEAVKKFREGREREATKKLANYPMLFGEIRQPQTNFVLIPRHSSENRRYIPLSYFTPAFIVGDSCLCLEKATFYHFGVLSSDMHMAWVKQVCGRIKSDYRYSTNLVYNNFPWPDNPTVKQVTSVEMKAKVVLEVREEFKTSTLADLYDPLAMPPKLVKAHTELDRAVDLCYRSQPFPSDRQRIEFLFSLYEKYTAPLVANTDKPSRKKVTPKII